MRTHLIISLLLLSIIGSCQRKQKYAVQLSVADTLVRALQAYDTAKVMSMTGVNPENIGEDREFVQAKLARAKRLLENVSIPKTESFTIKEYPNNSADLIDVTVPLNTAGRIVVIRFVKFLPPNKIAFFQLDGPVTLERTIAPPRSDN